MGGLAPVKGDGASYMIVPDTAAQGRNLVVPPSIAEDETLDHRSLGILIDATAEVVGEVSKVYQAIRRATEGGIDIDLLSAARAFDNLPQWQRQRIFELATDLALSAAAEETD